MSSISVAKHKKYRELCSRYFFIQAAGLAYHHDAVVDIIKGASALVSHHALACICLRLDDIQRQAVGDIQCFALMILHAFGVIGTRNQNPPPSNSRVAVDFRVEMESVIELKYIFIYTHQKIQPSVERNQPLIYCMMIFNML